MIQRAWLARAVLPLILACRSEVVESAPPGAPRVLSLHDVTTELVVALAASEQLVGVSRLVDPTPSVRAATALVPEVGSLESMLALRPTVALGLEVIRHEQPSLVARLEAEGVTVYLGSPGSLDAMYLMTAEVGALLGATPRAERLDAELRQRIARSRVTSAAPLRVFVYDCCSPPFSAGGRGVLNELITLAGGQNIFADIADDWASVSWEEVLARRPELVIVHAYEHAGQADVAGKLAELAKLPGLAHLPHAVLPLGCSLGGLRSAEGLERLRRALEGAS